MSNKKSFIKFLVILFPVGLFVMAVVSLFLFEKRRVDKQDEAPFSQPITVKGMISHYKKLEDYMTPRGFQGEQEVENLLRTTAFIEGNLSYMNTGMNVESVKALTKAGRIWKTYTLKFKGKGEPRILRFNYCEMSNAELSCALVIAEALPNLELSDPLHIIFHPDKREPTPFIPATTFQAARDKGQGNSLNYGGVDWDYLSQETEALLNDLVSKEFEKPKQ